MCGFTVTTLYVWIYHNHAVCVDLPQPRCMCGFRVTTLYLWIYRNDTVCVDANKALRMDYFNTW